MQVADDRADVGLEQTGANDDQQETGIKRRHGRDSQAVVSDGDEHAAVEDRAPLANQTVGDPAAWQREGVHTKCVQAVHRSGRAGIVAEAADGRSRCHEQDQQRAHAVVAEAFPHLGKEERGQPARVAEEGCVADSHGLRE
jgi:hypothetical protein